MFLHIDLLPRGVFLLRPQLLPQSSDSCVSILAPMSPSKTVAGEGKLATSCIPLSIEKQCQGCQAGEDCSANCPLWGTGCQAATHRCVPLPTTFLEVWGAVPAQLVSQALASGAAAKAHHLLT